ncbi:MAG: N-6 DNA methylase [Mediterranea sp.]|jgi:hypothetical protein|nr:N-6 DNA methylase [Mediterranea sp.]
MGRFKKEIITQQGIDKREVGYYSTPDFIAKYITKELLALNPNGVKVLDPATGKEELLKHFYNNGKEIDSFDIVNYGEKKYSSFIHADFLEYYQEKKRSLFFSEQIDLEYDYIIANPPYNCHEVDYIRKNKERLNLLFKEVGTYNMYSMFLSAIVDSAKEGALIGVIVSDSFLTASMHCNLRKQLLSECAIHQIILCPTDLFANQKADVRTCILILQKGTKFQSDVLIANRPANTENLKDILKNRKLIKTSIDKVSIESDPLHRFVIDVDMSISNLFSLPKIGDIFQCVTGISTGNDKHYLSPIRKEGYDIPFYKNPGKRKFRTQPDAYLINNFMEESTHVKNFIVRNKKMIFEEGITCSSMGLPFSACYLPKNSAFGVNANIFTPKEDIFWMISYLNSSLVTYIVRGVLIRSNMVTSGYISQIPILSFSSHEKEKLQKICTNALNDNVPANDAIAQIDEIVFNNISIESSLANKVTSFAANLTKAV